MTATTEPRGGLDFGWSPGEDGWGPNMNANLLRISRFGFHCSVLSATTTAPPGSLTAGAGFIIPTGATGPWAGKTGQVAVWDGSAWAYAIPRDGWTVHVVDSGLLTYEDGVWSQANAVKPALIGAEPYAGVPAQTSFWRSTAAGVRAWVQLVAADITDLATTLAGYLTKANPAFTGNMTGPTQTLEADAQLLLTMRRPGGFSGRTHGISLQAQTLNLAWANFGRILTHITAVANGAQSGGMRLMSYNAGVETMALEAGPTAVRVGAGLSLQMDTTTIVDSSRNGSFASLTASSLAGTGTRPLVATSAGLQQAQDAATFLGTIGAASASDLSGRLPIVALSGAIDFNSINSSAPCVAVGDGTSYANSPYLGTQLVGYGGTLYQGIGATGIITQIWADGRTGTLYYRGKVGASWGAWASIHDSYNLPAGTTGKSVLAAATAAAARTAISAAPLAGAEVLIHSDFGRSATTDVWQSAFTNNTASGLQLSANSTGSGTEITIEQVLTIPADGGASVYQVYIGPQLTGEQSPSGSAYVDVIDPNVEYGTGTLKVKIELIGSGSSITGHVTSTFSTSTTGAPFVRTGTITVDGTIANSIDIRFNPDSTTGYVIRRNRVFRRNP